MMKSKLLIVLAALLWTAPARAQASFSDQTQSAGLSFVHDPSDDHFAQTMDGGGAVGDFNRDGRPDLFVIGGGDTPDRLFINLATGFEDQAADWGLSEKHRGVGVSVGDFDGDGWDDLFITSAGASHLPNASGRHRLYRNQAGAGFIDVATAAGVASTGSMVDGFGSTFGDYDLDGDLDLYVCCWMLFNDGSKLFRNEGDGTFTDVTLSAGVYDPALRGFSPRFADMDGDRYPELIVAGDFETSRYFRNNRDGTFTNLTQSSGTGKDLNGMGSTILDYNRDGLMDWYVTAIYYDDCPIDPCGGNFLYENRGDHSFTDLPPAAGAKDGGWGWGTSAIDADHDGWTDLIETNGWTDVSSEWHIEDTYLFHNQGDGTFQEIGASSGIQHQQQGRGLIHLDYDLDGDLDVVIFSHDDSLLLLRNEIQGPQAHWLKVRLDTSDHPGLAPQGRGSKVRLLDQGQQQSAYVDAGCNYLSQSEVVAHFGLGNDSLVDELIVEWPDGFQTRLQQINANQSLIIYAEEPLSAGPLVRGTTVDFDVRGCIPGEFVTILYSVTGAGKGIRKDLLLGGRCLGLLEPVSILGANNADTSGVMTLPVQIPPTTPLVELSFQAMIPRGLQGARSALSNVVTAEVLP